MKTIHGVVRNGTIVPEEAFDWPDGSRVLIEPMSNGSRPLTRGMTEEEQGNTPEQIERWVAETNAIGPLTLSAEEEAVLLAFQQASKEFNREAVRRQMERRIIE